MARLATAGTSTPTPASVRHRRWALCDDSHRFPGEGAVDSLPVPISPPQSPEGGDFTVELGFEADQNKFEYGYTGFTVHFTLNKKGRDLGLRSHPFKFTVEFS